MNGKGSKSAQLIEKERAETGRVNVDVASFWVYLPIFENFFCYAY